jgi:histidinol-phosphate phosphatase family protein
MLLSVRDLPTVILCGGLGTRLAGVLNNQPKVLAPVCGRPFLAYLLDQLVDAGLTHVILAIGHLGDQVRETFQHYYRGVHLAYSQETTPLGTGGALRLAARDLQRALVMNGDSYFDVDLAEFIRNHFESAVDSSIALAAVEDVRRFGSVEADVEGLVRAFREKTSDHSDVPTPGLINAGIYIVSQSLIASIPDDHRVSLEYEVFPAQLDERLHAWTGRGHFIDIGTPESLATANHFFKDRGGPCKGIVFLDRDGTVNVDRGHLSDVKNVELAAGAARGIRVLNKLGWPVVVISNQSVVARRDCSLERLKDINARIIDLLGAEGATLDGIYCCPHALNEDCMCRKPKLGLLQSAARIFNADLTSSFLIGDKSTDIEAGLKIGAITFLIRTDHNGEREQDSECSPHYIVEDLNAAAQRISALLGVSL